jgi:4-hydroxy-tetrahydrodipicolinate synthase
MQVTPYYNKATPKGLINHFGEIAKVTDLPVMLYNVPSRTALNMAPDTVYELSKIRNIVCVKEASGDISQIAEIARLTQARPGFDIYSGNDDQTVPIMSLGGVGVVSVAANIAPRQVSEMCHEYLKGNVEESKKIQLELLDLIAACFIELSPAPTKAALEMMGLAKGYMRSPMYPVGEENREKIRKALVAAGVGGDW